MQPSADLKKASRKPRRWAIATLLGTAFLLALVAALVIVVDPFQQYRKASFYTPLAERTIQRYINVGIAKNYDYDTLSLGSSLTENTRTTDIEAAFGGKAVNLAFRGAALGNYSETMRAAFRTHKNLKRVLICVDDLSFTDSPFNDPHLPMYLFDNNILNDVEYWFNLDVLKRLPELYEYNVHGQDKAPELDLDLLYNWTETIMLGKARVFAGFPNWNHPIVDTMSIDPIIPNVEGNLNKFFLPFITAHPDTEFDIIYPPYSTLEWYNTYILGQEDRFLYGRTEFARQLLKQPNVRIFDFQAHEEWATDYEQYADYTHSSGLINTAYIQAMGRGENEVHSVDEVEANNQVIRQFIRDFVPPTKKELAKYHEEANEQTTERLEWQ